MKQFLMVPALMLVMGMGIAPAAQAHDHDKGARHGHPMKCMKAAFDTLPAEKAALFKQSMEKLKAEGKEKRGEMKSSHEELHNLMTAENFDKNAYIAKSKEMQAKRAEMHAKRTEAFADTVAQLTTEERKKFAEARLNCWKGHADKDDDDDDHDKAD